PVCARAARAAHEQPRDHGRAGQRPGHDSHGLDRRRADHLPQRLPAFRDAHVVFAVVSLAEDFQAIVESLPPDWTHLQFDLRIEEEDRYVELAPIVSEVNAWPLSKADHHWRFNVAREFGHAAAPETVRGNLGKL